MRGLSLRLTVLYLFFFTLTAFAQKVTIEGYVYESGNRGYLNEVQITVLEKGTNVLKTKAISNQKGVFLAEVDAGGEYILKANKKVFEPKEIVISTLDKNPGDKIYAKMELIRAPGYRFEVTLAERRKKKNEPTDAIHNARIEVFNNTTKKEVLVIEDNPLPTFACHFEQGNHYTIMVRREGYFVKRMEAYVNVKGCILCFDGVGEVTPGQPGVSDVLTEGNKMGTLLANVEMQPIKMNESIVIENIYYDVNKYRIKKTVAGELDKLAIVLNDNPSLLVEIGSHTDSNGKDNYNMRLSKNRARKVVEYLVSKGVEKSRIVSKGYGETKLTNKCKNGVDCSERRHAKNRRTELKVIGYVHASLNQDKSLAEIKEVEAFEKMLLEIQNQEVIKVEEGQELPDEIKKHMDGKMEEESKAPIPTDVKKETTEIKETLSEASTPEVKLETPRKVKKVEKVIATIEQPIAKVEETVNPIPPVEEKTLTTLPEKAIEKTEDALSGSIVYTDPANLNTKANTNTNPINTRNQTTTTIPKIEETNDVAEEFDAEYIGEENNGRVFGEVEVNTNHAATMRMPHKLASEYSGYMVQFYTSPSKLPTSHEIFSKHGNITMEERKDGTYAYLLGDFKDEEDAQRFLESIMEVRYPGARVIRFKRGNRMN